MEKVKANLDFGKEKDPAGIVADFGNGMYACKAEDMNAEWNPIQGKSEVPKDEVDPAKASFESETDDNEEEAEDGNEEADELEATGANPNASGMALPADTEKVDITMGAVPQGNENMGADIHNGVGNGPTETVLPTEIGEYVR